MVSESLQTKKGKPVVTESELVEVAIPKSWVQLIQFVQTTLPHGQLCVKISATEPTKLVHRYTEQDIRFDKGAQLPTDLVNFSASDGKKD